MREKFRLFLCVHERTLFRVMMVSVWLVCGLAMYIATLTPLIGDFGPSPLRDGLR